LRIAAQNSQSTVEVVVHKDALKRRAKPFALRVVRLVEALARGRTAHGLGRQGLRSGTSVGENDRRRAAGRAKSIADLMAKMGIVEEESNESGHWMELLAEAGILKAGRLESLTKVTIREGHEILAITVASINAGKKHPSSRFEFQSAIRNGVWPCPRNL
jgi:four helix bundle protein